MEESGKLLTIVLGPTAVGKSAYAIKLAKETGSPVINCDSRQIYREFRIGTAVPTDEELGEAEHYLVRTHSITEHYTAGLFEMEALALLQELFRKHDRVIMCGGSGLYIDALCNGLDDFPKADLELRGSLTDALEREGLGSLVSRLREADPESFASIDLTNPQRVIRALEVTLQTGRKYSDWKTGSGDAALSGRKRPFAIEKIGLRMDRERLYERINRRVDDMMAAGLLDEVRGLDRFRYADGVLRADLSHLPALRTVGYRELFDYIDGRCDLATAVGLIKRNTRRYAKRQLTWWGRDKSIKWIDV